MGWFEKQQRLEEKRVIADLEAELGKPLFATKPEEPQDEWIWVNGYKGTDKDMKCRDYQYNMTDTFDMPDESEIKECESGFHLCKNLKDVFCYYGLSHGNRFFHVSALVRKTDYEDYRNKLVAKSIIFLEEISPKEVFDTYVNSLRPLDRMNLDFDSWTDEDIQMAMETCIDNAFWKMRIRKLEALGYSRPFATHIISIGGYDVALAVGSQADLSMDTKAMYIYDAVTRVQMDSDRRSRNPRYSSYSYTTF